MLVRVVCAGCAFALFTACATGDDDARRAEVAARGAEVMPFDLERTTHVFRSSATGGVQIVVADDVGDDEQIALVRAHLAAEARRFARGDFSDPAHIHGSDMPGLATLERAESHIDVAYDDVALGGRITYTSDDPQVVGALHEWFDAQVHDHGEHALGM